MKILKAALLVALSGAATFVYAQDDATPSPPQAQGNEVLMLCATGTDGDQQFLVCHTPTQSESGSSSQNDNAPSSQDGNPPSSQDNSAPSSGDNTAAPVESAYARAPQTVNSRSRSAHSSQTNSSPSSSQVRQGDPNAPQNHIEYGGGGE